MCSIQTEKQFLLSTLEFFNLPKGYMDGAGHFPLWGKEKDDKLAAHRKRQAKSQKQKKPNIIGKKKKQKDKKKAEEEAKPTHFDISVF